jgi:exosortase
MIPARSGRRDFEAAAIVLAALALAYAPVLVRLARQWATDENASHGLLVVPLAVYLLWSGRAAWRATPSAPSLWGLGILIASLGLFAAGILGAELFLSRISIVGLLAGAVAFIWGWGHVRRAAFPLTLVALAIPLPAIVLNQITMPLQLVASRAGEGLISLAGIPVLREGNVLILTETTLEVAEACSGIRSLVSLLTIAVAIAYLRGGSTAGGAVLVAAAIPIAIVANAARVAGTGVAAHMFGSQAAEGFFHGFSGWIVFGAALVLLLAAERGIAAVERRADRRRAAVGDRGALEVTCAPAP